MQNSSNMISSSSGSHRRVASNSSTSSANLNTNTKELLRPLSLAECVADGSPPPPLVINDKVVWISDNGPEYGVVKWLGKLPDVGNDWMAGVDFINPVGSGTGLYNDHQLFDTRINHASLVPVIGLMKAQDYLGASNPTAGLIFSGSQSSTPQKPRRIKANKKELEVKSDDKRVPLSHLSSNHKTSDGSPIESHLVTINDPINRSLHSKERSIDSPKSKSNNTSNSLISYSSPTEPPVRTTSLSSHLIEKQQKVVDKETTNSWNNSISSAGFSSQINGVNGDRDFEIGSVVEISIDGIPRFGVVQWIGLLSLSSGDENYDSGDCLMAGIELEDELPGLSDGTYNGRRYFECAPRKGYFVKLNQCLKDSRFASISERRRSALFGSIDCPTVTGDVPPLSTSEDLQALCGKNRGIQGHHNSCYLDATLFSMFSCTTIFESLLHRPPRTDDIPEYKEVQRILKEEIVNPLRANLYVRADRVMHLRTLLEKISSVRGLTTEEKDPEEFINLLLNQILKAEPFLKLSSGLESFFYQLFVEKDEKLTLPTVQQLFDQSFLASDIKLREVPPCLLIQMPRFGRQFKMYPRIVPSLYLDITDVLDNSPRQCAICGQCAEYECKECFGLFGEGLDSTAFCGKCIEKNHSHKKRSKHKTTKLSIPTEFNMLKEHSQVPRIYMELFAVLCIETSHYVSFVKCGSGPDSPWCFFDSMADRKGEQNGYNIPEVVSFPDLRWWLSEEGTTFLMNTKDDKMLPEMPRRLFSDAYICWYASDVLRYR
ncbi:ubiquitin carboxyl-terminal hydrolase CYLD-like [Oppia nitens]|uniref:ubiquitin carboxyl-terminal hydrolase CYLD-like n=1 Tax=Oppia nitens TaxID=1686743 RepID=UPI0023DA55EE|nr:ubiquitin carboxyl-terminal hydrolase CYLD-like [Oppia nitens]